MASETLVVRAAGCGGIVIERHRHIDDPEPEHVLYVATRAGAEGFVSALQSVIDGLGQVYVGRRAEKPRLNR